MSFPAQVPLGSTVNSGVSSHSRGWPKKTHTYVYVQTGTHTTQASARNAAPQLAAPSPKLLPHRLGGSRPPAHLHFLLPSSFSLRALLFFTQLFFAPVWRHALQGARTTLIPPPLTRSPPIGRGGGGGEYQLHRGPQVTIQVSRWISHST